MLSHSTRAASGTPPRGVGSAPAAPPETTRGQPPAGTAVYAAVFTLIQLLYGGGASSIPLTSESVALAAVGGLLASLLLGALVSRLPVKPVALLGLLWLSLFVVQLFADLLEGTFFTTRISSPAVFLGGTLFATAVTLAESVAAVLVFRTPAPSSLRALLKAYFGARSGASWSLRVIVGSVAYFPVYFLFGALVSPLVIPYYTNPANGLGLVIPSFSVMVPVELGRGALFVLALVPLVAVVGFSRRGTFLFLALFLYVVGAYVPFVAGTTLPWTLKLVHSVEIFADSVVYGAILARIFKRG